MHIRTLERNVKDCHPFRLVHTKLHNGYKTYRGAPLNQNNYLLGWVHLQQTRKGLVINTLQQHCMKKVSVLLFYSEIDFAFFTFPWDVIVRALLCNPFGNASIWNAYDHYGFGSICFDIFSFFSFSFVQDFFSFEKFVKVEHDNMKWGWNYLKVKKFWSTFQISFKLGGTNTMSFLTFHCPMAECCALQFSFGKRIWQFRNCNLSAHSSIKNQYIQ